jgi:FkbM family methyltransferase
MIAGMIESLKALVRRIVRPPLHRPEIKRDYEVLGSAYGGWPLLLDTPRGSLIYSFGVGEDISFDCAAIERFDCFIHAFDPTPRCNRWIEQQNLPAGFQFHPLGIAAEDGELEFYEPANRNHVSFSKMPDPMASGRSVKVPVKRLLTILRELGTAMPEAVKMDIEGFEYEVLEDILQSGIRPRQLLLEFHHRMYGIGVESTRNSVARLRAAGYGLYYVSPSGHEYGFVDMNVH